MELGLNAITMKDVIKKLKFKGDSIVINAPVALEKELIELGFSTSFDNNVKSTNTLIFVNNNDEYLTFLKYNLENTEPDSVLWFAYPKGSSGIKTDINRDTLRITAEQFDITTVTAISINDTWSSLRFRPIDKVGK